MIERVLTSCFVYLWQLLCLALPSAAIALIVRGMTQKKKAAAAALAVCLLLELGAAAWISRRPFFRCPEEYRSFISPEEHERIVGYNSGLWSARIPVFPVCVRVLWADGERVHVKTRYLFFGSSEMEIGLTGSADPVPSLIRGPSWPD